jgi:hypothetical protein
VAAVIPEYESVEFIASRALTALAIFALISAPVAERLRGADELTHKIAAISEPRDGATSVRRNPSLFTRRSDAFAAQNRMGCLPVSVYDGFEGQTLSNLWQTILLAPGALKLQSRMVRAGHGAAKITLQARDKFEPGANGAHGSERDELVEARRLVAQTKDNCAYEYSFSMSHYYFKMGLYRNVMSEPMNMYVDEYRKKNLPLAEF